MKKKTRCWKGYEAVVGKPAYSKGSCRKVRGNPTFISDIKKFYNQEKAAYKMYQKREEEDPQEYVTQGTMDAYEYVLQIAPKVTNEILLAKLNDVIAKNKKLLEQFEASGEESKDQYSLEGYIEGLEAAKMRLTGVRGNPARALTDKLKKQAKALIPRFYREYKGASDWWHSVKVGGKYYDFNFLTHDPDGTGGFPAKLRNAVKVVAYKVVEDKDGGLRQSDRGLIRLGYFNGRYKMGNRMYKDRRAINRNPAPAGYHTMPDGRVMADSAHSNPARRGQKVRVLRDEYWNDSDSISAEINGKAVWIPYALVDGAELIPSSRTDGFETIILTNGKRAKVQSIDLDFDVAKNRVSMNPKDQGDYNSPEVSIVYKAKYSDLGWQGSGGSVEKFANSLGGSGTGGGTDMRTGLRDKSFKFKTIAGAVKFASKMKPYARRISAGRYNHDTMKREKLPVGKPR